MTRHSLATALVLLGLAPGLRPAPAAAQSCEPPVPGDPGGLCVLIPDGASSDDVAPYCFLPTLLRGQNTANYAVTAIDSDDGTCHDFRTFLRFALPPDLLGPGETVQEAVLDVPYLFSFSIDGPPEPPPHSPVSLSVHEVHSPWTENAVSWDAQPDFDPVPWDNVAGITDFGNVGFDVTELVRIWAQSPAANYGLALTSPDDRVLGFHSWESPVEPEFKAALFILVGPGTPPLVCGDADADGDVDASDVQRLRLSLADPAGAPLTPDGAARCSVIGDPAACGLVDAVVLRQALADPPSGLGIEPVCTAAAES